VPRTRTPKAEGSAPVPDVAAGMGDMALVRAVARGDDDALAEIYTRHAPRLRRLADRLCGANWADDIVHDVFLQLWRKAERYDPDQSSLGSFLTMQVHSRAIERLRSEHAHGPRESVLRTERSASVRPDVEAAALTRLTGAAVAAMGTALPDEEWRPIVLAYFGGHTYREVATMLGLPEGTVKSRIRSGLQRLRAQSMPGGHDPDSTLREVLVSAVSEQP